MPFWSVFTNNPDFVRRSLRTPGILIFGLVLSPCGWILNLTSTVAPNWRTLHGFQNRPDSFTIEQGIWDVCVAAAAAQSQRCGLTDTIYFKSNQVVTVAQGMMIASLIVTLIGLGFAIPGVRCWKEKPLWVICAIAGLLIFLSGALTIIPIAWYNHVVGNITSTFQENGLDIRVGYCIVLGYIGGIFEVLAGIVMIFGLCRCCKGWNRDERPIEEAVARAQRDHHQPRQYPPPRPERRHVDVPSLNRTRSGAGSSVPYSKDSMDDDDDVSFPRAKSVAARSDNSSFNSRPYDADL